MAQQLGAAADASALFVDARLVITIGDLRATGQR